MNIRKEDHELHPYLAGEFITTANPLQVKAPYNDELISTTFLCGTDIIEKAIQQALNIQPVLKALPAYKKYEILMQINRELLEDKEYLAYVLAREAAKPYIYALAEIERAAQTFLVAAEESKRLHKEYISLDWTPAGKDKEGIVKYFPIGPVAGISPFNFPLNLAVHKIAPAIAAGCPIILKPASSTPLSTLLLAKIIHRTELPKGGVSILPADRKSGNMLVTDERIRLLSFTGSDLVGWEMKKNAGKKKVVLELGGNAGTIISGHTGDFDTMVDKCFGGAFAYAGQICIHSQRFWVHESIFDRFVKVLAEKTKTLVTGAPENKETTFTVMIDTENAERVEAWISEAVKAGAKIVTGGKRNGRLVEPTILTHTNDTMKVEKEEAFGPVITITPFQQFEEAVAALNKGRFGLQASVFTSLHKEVQYAFDHIEAGGVLINEPTTLRLDHMPYGGVKDSGLGREGVRYAIHDMLEPRILLY